MTKKTDDKALEIEQLTKEIANKAREIEQKFLQLNTNTCGSCRAIGNMKPPCKGHAGASGGGKVTGGELSKTSKIAPAITKDKIYAHPPVHHTAKAATEKALWIKSELDSERVINFEAGMFLIESNRVHGDLSFQIKPDLSKEDKQIARDFLKLVAKDFSIFKDALKEADDRAHVDNFKIDTSDKNKLSIHIPHPTHYNAFINWLDTRNLFPIPKAIRKLDDAKESKWESAMTKKMRNPLSTRLEVK